MKNILLVGINAKYTHTALGVLSIGAYLRYQGVAHSVAEYSVNDPYDSVFYDIIARKPDVIGFSTYLWNITLVRRLMADLKLALPRVKIFLGGPEAGYSDNPETDYPDADFVVRGEGEAAVYKYLTGEKSEEEFPNLPFPYEFPLTKGKTVYYEASRGCPYRCSYCISSLEKNLRFKDLETVKQELQAFIDAGANKVKFIDRTFNVNPHAYQIWEYIIENGGNTGFHFEIKPELFSKKDFDLLKTAPKGRIQFEAGLQSLNEKTLSAIHRTNDVEKSFSNLKEILNMGNIHLHLDLIAGLPFEDKESFIEGFNRVYELSPHMLQLGFLKILNGTEMKQKAEEYGILYSPHPPYQVIGTRWLSVEDILELKIAENGLDTFSNKGFFPESLAFLWKKNQGSYYDVFLSLG
ncbi:MAG: B12-binding domain-containing radical SAM protein, partial [Clostridia bacterium]|nr:B12-binding domain-containing radical SAM protein [Clostridia bacterium]